MADSRNYTGIDIFRIVAAFLIVAIHTSPLSSFSETGDFILTRIIARIAVPFFFMTSGFFLISRYSRNTEKLNTFIRKTCLIYTAAILIYIPINIYNNYFEMDNLLPNIIKDIVFDGTLYHLWYLPASVIGAVIAWYLVKKFGCTKALLTSSILYFIGMFGDSYYGLIEKISGFNTFYRLIFQVSDYTRNGIFFAPVFFVMGGLIADNRIRMSLKKSALGFVASFALMFGEAMTLHRFNVQRHDSMYLFLIPCMYFLFNAILNFRGKRIKSLRTLSLVIYIVHPMMIIAVRACAKLLNLWDVLVENSIIHYFAVCFASMALGMVFTVLINKYDPQKNKSVSCTDRAHLEINLSNLEHNVNRLKRAIPERCELMAVVKAEAYGHGMYEIAVHLNRIGVKAFAVATIDEAIELRKYGISGEILIMGYTSPERAKELVKYDLIQTLIDYEYSVLLNELGYRIKAHMKIDTGMHRLGFDAEETENILNVFKMRHIQIIGIYTHLCVSDSLRDEDVRFTKKQIESFYKLLHNLQERNIAIPKIHIQSSYGLLNYPELKCDYLRVGVALYGVLSHPDDNTKLKLRLKPVLSLKSKVILLRTINRGESAGYGREFTAERKSVIAIIPIGYADGFPRNLSCGKSYVLINGQRARVVGRVCMDQLAADVTDIPEVKVGTTVTLIGKDGKEKISSPEVASEADSITNEILSRMGRRLKVIATDG